MNVIIFDTHQLQAQGLQHLSVIPMGTLYIFPLVAPGTYFHSNNVAEDFDIAFIAEDFTVLTVNRITPPKGGITAPAGTAMAVEAKAATLKAVGFAPGAVARF